MSWPGKSAKRVFALDDPAIHPLRKSFIRRWMDTRVKPAYDRQWRYHASLNFYSITACSGASACLRSAALLEPIMIASGIAHSVKIITIW
jgi:hypothetical protein